MKKTVFLFAAFFCAASAMADVAVGDVISYTYEGNTLWYEVGSSSVTLTTPEKTATDGHYYGTNPQPTGVVTVADSVEVNGKKLPVTSANGYTFYGLKGITEVIYQAPIGYLGWYTFQYSSVTSVTVPNTVTSFSNGVFQYADNLDTVIFEDLENVPSSSWDTWLSNGMLNSLTNDFLRIGNFVFNYKGTVPDNIAIFPEGVVGVSSYAVYSASNKANIKAFVFPSTVTKICEDAACGCVSLDSVVCLATVPPTIHSESFYSATGAANDRRLYATLYVPWSADHSVKAAYLAHAEWSKFASVLEIGAPTYNVNLTVDNAKYGGVKLNGKTAGAGAIKFTAEEEITITVEPTAKGLFDQIVLGSVDRTEDMNADGSVVIAALTQDTALYVSFVVNPDAPIVVGDTIPYTYEGNTLWYKVSSSSVTLVTPEKTATDGHCYGTNPQPTGVVTVADSVEVNGKKLPVTSANSNTFAGLKGITEVIYQAPIGDLGWYTFQNSSVTSVTVPNTVTSFSNGVFQYANNLDTVIFEDWENVPSSCWDTWLSNGMLNSLTNDFLRIGNFVFNYKGTVSDNIAIFPEGVVGVSSYAVYSASNKANIKAFVFPSTVTKICDDAASGCVSLDSVVCLATVPPTIHSTAFYSATGAANDRRSYATLYVPWSADHSVKAAYLAHAEWSKFSSIVELPEPTPTAVEQVTMDQPKTQKVMVDGAIYIIRGDKVYNLQGIECELPMK